MKNLFLVLLLCLLTLFFNITNSVKAQTDPVGEVIYNAMVQIKNVLINGSSPSNIEEMINQTRNMGASGIKAVRYVDGTSGWNLYDSKGKEVQCIIISFANNRAKQGKYLGPLTNMSEAQEIHAYHLKAMAKYFRHITANKYDLGNNYTAAIELFKGTMGLGRTVITVN